MAEAEEVATVRKQFTIYERLSKLDLSSALAEEDRYDNKKDR